MITVAHRIQLMPKYFLDAFSLEGKTATTVYNVVALLAGVVPFLMLMIFGTPVATSSYPMAVNMGGDGPLAGQLVFVSTVASLLTIFLFIFGMGSLGILY